MTPGTQKNKRKSFLKLFARLMIYAGLFLAILTAGLFLYLQTDSAKDLIRKQVIAAMEGATQSKFHIGRISGNLITAARLEDVAVYGRNKNIPIFAFDRISLKYPFPWPLARRFYIHDMDVSGFSTHIAADENDRWNTAALLPPPVEEPNALPDRHSADTDQKADGEDFRLIIGNLTIDNADLTLSWYAWDSKRTLVFTDGRLDGKVTFGNQIDIGLNRLAFNIDPPNADFTGISGRLVYDLATDRLIFDQTDFRTADSRLIANGSITFPGGADFDLKTDILGASAAELGRIFSLPASDTTLTGSIHTGGRIDALTHEMTLYWEDSALEALGIAHFTGPTATGLEISGKIRNLEPQRLPVFPLEAIPAGFTGDIDFHGAHLRSETPEIDLRMQMGASRLLDYSIREGIIHATFNGQRLSFEHLEADTQLGRIRAQGGINDIFAAGPKDFSFSAGVSGFNAAEIAQLNIGSSDINCRITAEGSLPDALTLMEAEANLSVTIDPSRILRREIETGEIEAAWAERLLRLEKFALKGPPGSVSAGGVINVADQTCDGHISSEIFDISMINSLFPEILAAYQLGGSASLNGDMTGKWHRPDIQASVTATDFRANDFRGDRLAARAVWSGNLTQYSLSGSAEAKNIHFHDIALEQVEAQGSLDPSAMAIDGRTTFDSGDRLSLKASVAGWQKAEKQIAIDRVNFSSHRLPSVSNTGPIRLTLSDNRQLEVQQLHLNAEEADIEVKGFAPLAPGGKVSAEVAIEGLDIGRLHPYVPALAHIRGLSSARLNVSGALSDPKIQVQADIADTACYGIRFTKMQLNGDYEQGNITYQVTGARNEENALHAQGRLAARFGVMPLEFELLPGGMEAEVDIEGLRLSELRLPESDNYSLDGTLMARARISGDVYNPDFTGAIDLLDGTLEIPDYGLLYETVKADLRFRNDFVFIKHILISGDTEGYLEANGGLAIEHLKPKGFKIRIAGENFKIPFRNAAVVHAEPDLILSGTLDAPELTGDIHITEGALYLERLSDAGPAEIEVINAPSGEGGIYELPEQPQPLAFIKPLAAAVGIHFDNDVWVRGKDENVEIAGDVRVDKKRGEMLRLYGTVRAIRGTYLFRGRLFKITEGELTFLGLEDIDPDVSIQAETRVSDVTIIIYLSGTPQNLQLRLDSEPAMDRVDIVSYLLFGRPSGGLSKGESFRAEEAALSITGQLAAEQIKQILGDSFQFDVLHISAGNGDIREGRVALGKYVAPNVFITYNQGFSDESESNVEVDYEINRHFSIEALITEERTSAVDLIWRHDFSSFLFEETVKPEP